MSFLEFNNKKKKKKKENKLLLFPKTYNFLLCEHNKKIRIKSSNKNNLKFIMKNVNQKKDSDNLQDINIKNSILNLKNKNKLPKIINSNSNLSKILKHNLSTSVDSNNIFNIDDYNQNIYKNRINNNNINNYSYDNPIKNGKDKNDDIFQKAYLNRQLSEIINSHHNININAKNILNKENIYIKTELNDTYKSNSKKYIKNLEYDNLYGATSIKKSNPLHLLYNANSNIILEDEFKLKSPNKIKYNDLNKNDYKDETVKNENSSTKTLYKKEKNKKNINSNNNKTRSPEELHFFYILMVQEGKKSELKEK